VRVPSCCARHRLPGLDAEPCIGKNAEHLTRFYRTVNFSGVVIDRPQGLKGYFTGSGFGDHYGAGIGFGLGYGYQSGNGNGCWIGNLLGNGGDVS